MKLFCSNKRSTKGFTLPEMLIGVAIGGLILAAIAATTVASVRSFASIYNYADMDMNSRTALDIMSRDIRGSSNVISASATSLVLNGATNVITYTWSSNANTLTRSTPTSSKTSLTKCSNWKVTMYTSARIATTDPTQCKMLSMNWKCWRKVIGVPETDNAQESVIMLRNKQ